MLSRSTSSKAEQLRSRTPDKRVRDASPWPPDSPPPPLSPEASKYKKVSGVQNQTSDLPSHPRHPNSPLRHEVLRAQPPNTPHTPAITKVPSSAEYPTTRHTRPTFIRASTKQILCLANSRKYGGACIAGKELLSHSAPGSWIRPISALDHEEVSSRECGLSDGSTPQPLDIVEVPILRHRPRDYQQENWLIDHRRPWKKLCSLPISSLPSWIDPVATLWNNGFSSKSGSNDRIPVPIAASLRTSLCLIRVPSLTISVTASSYTGKKTLRGDFFTEKLTTTYALPTKNAKPNFGKGPREATTSAHASSPLVSGKPSKALPTSSSPP